MDVTFSNMLEGTRQYFMGLPKQAQSVSGGSTQTSWAPMMSTSRIDEPHASDSRPSSATVPTIPPRPPSEPIEPEPHIIHKATVMREAAEKRREQPIEEEDPGALSPPSHIIHKPTHHVPPTISPAPAPQAPSPSPARPPSAAAPTHQPLPSASSVSSTPAASSIHNTQPSTSLSEPTQYRSPTQRVQTPCARPPDHFAPGRPPDPYSGSRPPESYMRYHYEQNIHEALGSSRGPPVVSPQPSAPTRQSPQTYARISSSMPQHPSSRLREANVPSPPSQRYATPPSQPQLLPNDRVPPIHHPHTQTTRVPAGESRASHYPPLLQHREPSPYGRTVSHYDRHPSIPQRKYDPQQAYSGYRPSPTSTQSIQNHRMESHHQVQYRNPPVDTVTSNFVPRPLERGPIPPSHSHELTRHSHEGHTPTHRKPDYTNITRNVDTRTNYQYPSPLTSVRYASNPPSASVPVVPSSTSPLTTRTVHRPTTTPKSSYEYSSTSHLQSSPVRSAVKAGYPNNQARMTVSVTTLVNQMNQTKHKRESPLDLSVKTVKNSADSSTTQDDLIDSASSSEIKTISLQPRPTSSNRQISGSGYVESHKVDFAPDFTQYRERSTSHGFSTTLQPSRIHPRYNGSYESSKSLIEPNPIESRHHMYSDCNKYNISTGGRNDFVSRIDLTRSAVEERRPENKIRDDRHFIIEERKRPAGPIVSNIPEKMVRFETWTADSRISDRMSQSAREQHELMSRPVYSYSSHKQFEAYQNEQKRVLSSTNYRDQGHRYAMYPTEIPPRERSDYHSHHLDRNLASSNRHIIQKIPSHRDVPHHHLDLQNGVPADKRVLSILRNSLETKQTGYVEPAKPARHIPDLIVIDDVDDSVIEITDLTKDNEVESATSKTALNHKNAQFDHHIQMPKAIDSIARDSDYQRLDKTDIKSKSPESDVASRIRTKAELKVMPPSHDTSIRSEVIRQEIISDLTPQNENTKLLPKSQKQHLFNQIREDSLRLESVIKSEKNNDTILSEVKTEPMNIEEIEKDAEVLIKTENILESLEPKNLESTNVPPEEDLDWASACDNFMEQLKSGCHKKKTHKKRADHEINNAKNTIIPKEEPIDTNSTEMNSTLPVKETATKLTDIVIKQEPLDFDEIIAEMEPALARKEKLLSVDTKVKELKTEVNDEDQTTSNIIDDLKIDGANSKKKSLISETSLAPKENATLSCKKKLKDTSCSEEKQKDDPSCNDKKTDSSNNINTEARDRKDSSDYKTKISTDVKDIKKTNESGDNKIKISAEVKETKQIKDNIENNNVSETGKKTKTKLLNKTSKLLKKNDKFTDKPPKESKTQPKSKVKAQKSEPLASTSLETKECKTIIKEEAESTDDDEPLIKSKLMKEKEMRYQLLKDLSEKSAYVKLECFDVDMNKNSRMSVDSITKEKDEKPSKGKTRLSRAKGKSTTENIKIHKDTTSDSDDDDLSVASRLRLRKTVKTEDTKESLSKISTKFSSKKQDNINTSIICTPLRKAGFGDGSDFHPGWEEELYRYKRSLRMPPGLIAIPRGRSGGPFVRRSGAFFSRGSTSLPDLDPAPLSPAPSSAPSAATDDLCARRQEKLNLDSDLESNSSCSAANRLHYDSEASTSTVFSSTTKKKRSSIVDVLIKKCGKRDESKKKIKEKDDKTPKIIPKTSNTVELLPTPSLGLIKNSNKGGLSAKKEKLMEEIFYLGAFRKETVSAFRNAFIKNTDGLIGATEEFAPVVLKSRTRTESRVLKQRATIKEVFGDERPASAPPICSEDKDQLEQDIKEEPVVEVKKEPKDPDTKPKLKPRKLTKDKKLRRSNSIRDGLRSTKSLKRNDAKGRMMRLKKRNSLMKTLNNKRMKDGSAKIRKPKIENGKDDKDKPKEEGSSEGIEGNTKKRLKRLFGRRKFSSGFDYIRKKKKLIRREDNTTPNNKIRRSAVKPSPESVHDIHKEIKGWFINKSIGETHLHRAARLGYMDCVAYCLEKLEAEPSAKDNAGYTPLHFAAAKGHVRIARLLLQYGADVSAAAQGGVRPLHEACENSHIEVIRLLLSYGADPLLGTYAGQTPEELTDGLATRFLRLHIADVQGQAVEPWRFPPPGDLIDREELGCDPLSSPPPASPPPPPDSMVEIQCTETPLPPFYSLKTVPGQPADGLWCLLQDLTSILQIKSKESLLKQIHCGSGSPKELLREIRTQEFLERAQCHQLLGAGEKVNVRASKVSLVRVTDKLRQLLKIETVLVS